MSGMEQEPAQVQEPEQVQELEQEQAEEAVASRYPGIPHSLCSYRVPNHLAVLPEGYN